MQQLSMTKQAAYSQVLIYSFERTRTVCTACKTAAQLYIHLAQQVSKHDCSLVIPATQLCYWCADAGHTPQQLHAAPFSAERQCRCMADKSTASCLSTAGRKCSAYQHTLQVKHRAQVVSTACSGHCCLNTSKIGLSTTLPAGQWAQALNKP
jgi:hypothetical protein